MLWNCGVGEWMKFIGKNFINLKFLFYQWLYIFNFVVYSSSFPYFHRKVMDIILTSSYWPSSYWFARSVVFLGLLLQQFVPSLTWGASWWSRKFLFQGRDLRWLEWGENFNLKCTDGRTNGRMNEWLDRWVNEWYRDNREQRVTGFCIHLLIGLSTLLTVVLRVNKIKHLNHLI